MEKKCLLCDSNKIFPFLKRTNIPTMQHYIALDLKEAKEVNRSVLDLFYCENCDFIFNLSFDISKIPYGQRYDNRQDLSLEFQSYTEKLIEY